MGGVSSSRRGGGGGAGSLFGQTSRPGTRSGRGSFTEALDIEVRTQRDSCVLRCLKVEADGLLLSAALRVLLKGLAQCSHRRLLRVERVEPFVMSADDFAQVLLPGRCVIYEVHQRGLDDAIVRDEAEPSERRHERPTLATRHRVEVVAVHLRRKRSRLGLLDEVRQAPKGDIRWSHRLFFSTTVPPSLVGLYATLRIVA